MLRQSSVGPPMENGIWFLEIKFLRIFGKIFDINRKPKSERPMTVFGQFTKNPAENNGKSWELFWKISGNLLEFRRTSNGKLNLVYFM
jgi:hypothetical protein